MAFFTPVPLHRDGLTLEPLTLDHAAGLAAAAADGELWNLRVTSVPEPAQTRAYVEDALTQQEEGSRTPFVVVDDATGELLGSTSYHDIVDEIRRVEIGYTFYRKSVQRTRVNTTCKLMLLEYAFDVLDCGVVGWRTHGENHASQAAIAALGAQRDGTIRRHMLGRDGTYRDTVFFSMLPSEWPAARERLEARLARHAADSPSSAPRTHSRDRGPR